MWSNTFIDYVDFLEMCFPNIKKHTKILESDMLLWRALKQHVFPHIDICQSIFEK
jgi:hypothetical protein